MPSTLMADLEVRVANSAELQVALSGRGEAAHVCRTINPYVVDAMAPAGVQRLTVARQSGAMVHGLGAATAAAGVSAFAFQVLNPSGGCYQTACLLHHLAHLRPIC